MKWSSVLAFGGLVCGAADVESQLGCDALMTDFPKITQKDIEEFQESWGTQFVQLGQIYSDNGDLTAAGQTFVRRFYDCEEHGCLVVPVGAYPPFRTTFDGVVSFFVDDNANFPNDAGEASYGYIAVSFQNLGFWYYGNAACVMGKVSYTSPKWQLVPPSDYTQCFHKHKHNERRFQDPYNQELKIFMEHYSTPVPRPVQPGVEDLYGALQHRGGDWWVMG